MAARQPPPDAAVLLVRLAATVVRIAAARRPERSEAQLPAPRAHRCPETHGPAAAPAIHAAAPAHPISQVGWLRHAWIRIGPPTDVEIVRRTGRPAARNIVRVRVHHVLPVLPLPLRSRPRAWSDVPEQRSRLQRLTAGGVHRRGIPHPGACQLHGHDRRELGLLGAALDRHAGLVEVAGSCWVWPGTAVPPRERGCLLAVPDQCPVVGGVRLCRGCCTGGRAGCGWGPPVWLSCPSAVAGCVLRHVLGAEAEA